MNPLLARNRSWAQKQLQSDPDYFQSTAQPQKPHTLWIGCSDSRVPAEMLTGSHPGELFVHRNIANIVIAEDDNLISVLQYALEYLGISRIVLCGHYGCGGVQAAAQLPNRLLQDGDCALSRRINHLQHSLSAPLKEFHRTHDDENKRLNQLIEANVLTQFSHLTATALVQNAWHQMRPLHIFGCVYDLQTGHLKQLVQQSAVGRTEHG